MLSFASRARRSRRQRKETHGDSVQIPLPRLIHNANCRRWLRKRLATGFELFRIAARQYLQCPCPSPGEILMQDDVVALFAYDRWANRRVLDACRKLTAEQYGAEPVPGWSSLGSRPFPNPLGTEVN